MIMSKGIILDLRAEVITGRPCLNLVCTIWAKTECIYDILFTALHSAESALFFSIYPSFCVVLA